MNLYAHYDINRKDWNGYQFSANWFKSFHTFTNQSYLAFQGYVDYQFGADDKLGNDFVPMTSDGGAAFFGLYWHTNRYALGYGLKVYKDVYLFKDKGGIVGLESTGWAYYLSATYKF